MAADKKHAKSHFNFVYDKKTFFDGVDWSKREKGQPFFAQVQIKEPHRGFVKAKHSFAGAPIPPYYPEHPVARADWADYLASIEVLDQKVGAVIDRLEAEGELDNTLIIFFGDHGRPHARCKQWLYDGGLHTPFIMNWPGKVKAGVVDSRLVSLL
ncbi:MAG: N-sulfoglucosamine sulfohydrolase, partial [Rhodothermales bacterium]